MALRQWALADAQQVVDVITSAQPQLQADGWMTDPEWLTLAGIQNAINDPNIRAAVFTDVNGVVRAVFPFRRIKPNVWTGIIAAVDPVIAPANRLAAFGSVLKTIAQNVPQTVTMIGEVKAGGAVDGWLITRLPPSARGPAQVPDHVVYTITAAQLVAVLP